LWSDYHGVVTCVEVGLQNINFIQLWSSAKQVGLAGAIRIELKYRLSWQYKMCLLTA